MVQCFQLVNNSPPTLDFLQWQRTPDMKGKNKQINKQKEKEAKWRKPYMVVFPQT